MRLFYETVVSEFKIAQKVLHRYVIEVCFIHDLSAISESILERNGSTFWEICLSRKAKVSERC